MAESIKFGKSGLSVEVEEELMRMIEEFKEKEGTSGLDRFIVNKMMDMEDKATGGDNTLYWIEATAIDSTQRINALDAELCEFRGECGKLVVEWFVKNGLPNAQAVDDAFLAQLGLFTDECRVLLEEYAKSAAELTIKKLRLVALADKHVKKRTLMTEIIAARKLWNVYVDAFELFKKKLSLEKDVGRAPVESPETARDKIKSLESALSNEKLESANVEAFTIESFRVLVELMRGFKVEGQQPVEVTYDAMVLGDEWMEAEMDVCKMKVWVGIMVERLSVFEVLKREIALIWKMEKYVKDKILFYQRKSATDIVEEEITNVGPHSQGDDTIMDKNNGVEAVLEAEEYIEVKKSEVFTLERQKSFATMSGGEETKQDTEPKTEQRKGWISMFGLAPLAGWGTQSRIVE